MYSKQAQLSKVKKDNPKKMSKSDLKSFRWSIYYNAKGICQLCNKEPICDYHHPLFGCRGADKDDRCQTGTCRKCHDKCHEDKHGFNLKAVEIGESNHKEWVNEIQK